MSCKSALEDVPQKKLDPVDKIRMGIMSPGLFQKNSQMGTFVEEIKPRDEESAAGKYNGDRGGQPVFDIQSLAES